ncbi:MAG: VOC family protein [Caldimonas sp.]
MTSPGGPRIEPDHLVVAARCLEEGVAWCEATLGVLPTAGGRHPAMATHNRVLALGSSRFPRTYLEIIAIDPQAPPVRARWFDLDLPAVRAAIAVAPRLVHWVARCDDLEAAVAALRAAGHEPGPAFAAERMTAHGLLRWRIAVRDDGHRLAGGALPLLIEWAGAHPCDTLADSGVSLERLEIAGDAADLAAWLGASRGPLGAPPLAVSLATPRGRVALSALG